MISIEQGSINLKVYTCLLIMTVYQGLFSFLLTRIVGVVTSAKKERVY